MGADFINETFFTTAEVAKLRAETTGTRNVIHLNNAGSGLMPDAVTQVQIDHLLLESSIGGYEAAALKSDAINAFYSECAILFNTDDRNIAFTASATDAFTRALSAIPFLSGDVILTDCDDFVSNQIQFLSLQKRFGVQIIHIANAENGGINLNDLREKLIRHKPRLLAITHIPTNSGLVQPVNAIASIFSEYRNAHPQSWYILDACQSAGQMKLDVKQLECDFMSITCRKFLRGPRGTGALYVSDRVLGAALEPMFIDMRGATWMTKNSYQQRSDAKRFEDWEFAYSTVLGTKVAIQYCRNLGEDRIYKQVQMLSSIMRNTLALINGVRVLDRGTEQGGLVTFHAAGSDPAFLVSELSKRKINVVPSYRAFGVIDFDEKGVTWAIRASPHYYNTLDEVTALADALAEII